MTRYRRYEPQVAQGLTEMFVAGVSTHKVGEVAQTLMGVAPSASAISRLNQDLEQQFQAWRERPLQEHWCILYLDGVHFSIRHGEKADSTIILTADSASTWREPKRCWHCELARRRTKMDGLASCKTCVYEAPPRLISS